MRHIAHRQCSQPVDQPLIAAACAPSRSAARTRRGMPPRRHGNGSHRHRISSRPQRAQDDQHASVEQLSVPVITAIASSCLVNRDTLADINPSFEFDTNIVPIPPEQSAFSNCEKVVERDVEVYRKKAQSICMHLGVRSANVVSYNAQFSTTIKEQQAICRMFYHRQSNLRYAAPRL